jgi:hypothetical protein
MPKIMRTMASTMALPSFLSAVVILKCDLFRLTLLIGFVLLILPSLCEQVFDVDPIFLSASKA